jgi:DNA-binding response OmpR family regulator
VSKKRILVVDDDPDLVELLRKKLDLEGFECLVAEDGHSGLELAKKEKPDLIVLDLMLPGMDGYKICRLLKFDDRYKHIPIIMLTARTRTEDRTLGAETGVDLYVTKPFSMKEFLPKRKAFLVT